MKSLKNFVVVCAMIYSVVFCADVAAQKVVNPTQLTLVFVWAWSEYTSWSAPAVAENYRISGKPIVRWDKGKRGYVEEKWGVDLVGEYAQYVPCITAYSTGGADIVCITNIDILSPALQKVSVVIMPSSTSYGADKVFVHPSIETIQDLRGIDIKGESPSVSEYLVFSHLFDLGENPNLYSFLNMNAGDTAVAYQQDNIKAGCFWNPYALQTLKNRKDSKVSFDSTVIPGEIIDTFTMSQEALDRPGGKNAACAVIEAYYLMCRVLADKKQQAKALVDVGKRFSSLNVEEMKTAVKETRFYSTPEQGIALFTGGKVCPWKPSYKDNDKIKDVTGLFTNECFDPNSTAVTSKNLKEIMAKVVSISESRKFFEVQGQKLTIGYGTKEECPDVRLRFDPSFMKEVQSRLGK